jgi:hypothetical protein
VTQCGRGCRIPAHHAANRVEPCVLALQHSLCSELQVHAEQLAPLLTCLPACLVYVQHDFNPSPTCTRASSMTSQGSMKPDRHVYMPVTVTTHEAVLCAREKCRRGL